MKYFLSILITALIFAGLGFSGGYWRASSNHYPTVNAPQPNPLFLSQSANVSGRITQINNSSIVIANTKGQAEFAVSPSVLAVIPSTDINNPVATPSSGLKSLVLNREAMFTLEVNQGRYEVVNISYVPVAPPAPAKKP